MFKDSIVERAVWSWGVCTPSNNLIFIEKLCYYVLEKLFDDPRVGAVFVP